MNEERERLQDENPRLDEVFGAYLKDLDAGTAPSRDELLRAHQDLAPALAALLDADQRLGKLMGTSEQGGMSPVMEAPGPGAVLGDYRLVREIARGGMGIVFEAEQRSLSRRVALKTMSSLPRGGDDAGTRFRREAWAAARLDHPNIVPIYDVGEHKGVPFFTMKLLTGGNLEETRERFTRDPLAGARLLAALARAVAHAHGAGVLHRDLKPANVVFDGCGKPYLTDFGLAKGLNSEDLTLTQSGAIVGTPAYMAPEQATRPGNAATPAVDVYGLGAVLYGLLTGGPPFRGINTLEILQALREEPPKPPRQLNRAVPRDLETICLKCLEKDPRRRYVTATALAEDLERFCAGRPVFARPVPVLQRSWRWACRNRTLSAVISLLLLMATVSSGAAVLLARSERRAREYLRQANLHQAAMARSSVHVGRRFLSLEALARAAAISPGLDLRNEAAACLALVDLAPVRTIEGHMPGRETCGAVDPGFQRHAYASPSGAVVVRSLASAAREMVRCEGRGSVKAMRFSQDGRFLGASLARTLLVWDLDRPEAEPTTVPGLRFRRAWDFSPAEPQVVVGGEDGRLRKLSLPPDKARAVEETSPNFTSITCVAFGAGGDVLAVGGIQGGRKAVVSVLDARTHEIRKTLPAPAQVTDLAWHPGGAHLAMAASHRVILWNVPSATVETELEGHKSGVVGLAFSPDGKLLATTGWDNTLRLWSPETRRQLVTAVANLGVTFSPDGSLLASTSNAGPTTLWKVAQGLECRLLRGKHRGENPLRTVEFCAGGRGLAIGGRGGVTLWDVEKGTEVAHLDSGARILGATVDPATGSLLLFGAGNIVARQVTTGAGQGPLGLGAPSPLAAAKTLTGAGGPEGLSLTGDGSLIAAAVSLRRGHACVVTREGRLVLELTGLKGLDEVAISPDGRWAAAGARHGASHARVWQVTERAVALDLPVGGNSRVAFSPDGRWLVTGSGQEYHLWKTGSWIKHWSMPRDNPGQAPGPAAFAPQSHILALVPDLTSIRLVEVETGRQLVTLRAPELGLQRTLAFDPTGRWLAAALENGSAVELWDLELLHAGLKSMKLGW